jgi:hypothetical protein
VPPSSGGLPRTKTPRRDGRMRCRLGQNHLRQCARKLGYHQFVHSLRAENGQFLPSNRLIYWKLRCGPQSRSTPCNTVGRATNDANSADN